MPDVIPMLSCATVDEPAGREWGVVLPVAFVEGFVALHHDDWDLADLHWGHMVSLVLETDAIEPHATSSMHLRQAVQATVILLTGRDVRGDCLLCRGPSRGGLSA
jgi:hypothetical protein